MKWDDLLKRLNAFVHRDWEGLADKISHDGSRIPRLKDDVVAHCKQAGRCKSLVQH